MQARAQAIRAEAEVTPAATTGSPLFDTAAIIQALATNAIEPYYQPTIDLSSGRIDGFEALARWHHPERGLVEPRAFAAAFESPDLAVLIGRHMLGRAGRDFLAWSRAGLPIARIAVNVADSELRQGDYAASLQAQARNTGLPLDRLTLELTGNVNLTGAADQLGAQLRSLHKLGVTIALDDFGAGLASLRHLTRLPIDRIKIDRSFVARIEDDPDEAAIVAALIGLARRLGIRTVAAGVETPAQLAFLRAEGCDLAQGYMLGRPMPAAAVPHFMAGVGR